jgi:hypothetical protein
MWWERLILYCDKFPEVMHHFAKYCTTYDEEHIEFLNALVNLFSCNKPSPYGKTIHFAWIYIYLVRYIAFATYQEVKIRALETYH